MKKIIQTATFILIFIVFISATSKSDKLNSGIHFSSMPNSFFSPRAEFKKQWVDYDVYENNYKGMRIHLTFTVNEMKDIDSYVLITFEKKNGDKYDLMGARSDDYSNLWDDLIVYKKLTPCCETTDYDDLQVFMPYDELNLQPGKYDLRMDVDITKSIDDNDQNSPDFIGHLNYYTFWFNK